MGRAPTSSSAPNRADSATIGWHLPRPMAEAIGSVAAELQQPPGVILLIAAALVQNRFEEVWCGAQCARSA